MQATSQWIHYARQAAIYLQQFADNLNALTQSDQVTPDEVGFALQPITDDPALMAWASYQAYSLDAIAQELVTPPPAEPAESSAYSYDQGDAPADEPPPSDTTDSSWY